MTNVFGIAAIIGLLIMSAFFSGTETGIYRLNRFRLRLGIEQGKKAYRILESLMADSHSLIFSVLIGNNLVNSIAIGITTYLFLNATGDTEKSEFYTALIMTPTLFVFGEVIPKNIYFYTADFLMPRLAPFTYSIHKAFVLCGAAPLLRRISQLAADFLRSPVSSDQIVSSTQRHHVIEIIRDTQEEGVLSSVQTGIMERLLNIPHTTLSSAMIGISKTQMVSLQTSKQELMKILNDVPFRRLIVYENSPSNIVGMIDIYEALSSESDFDDLKAFIKPLLILREDVSVLEALNKMRNEHWQMALVTRPAIFGKPTPLGIITMKDLVEELVGELAEW